MSKRRSKFSCAVAMAELSEAEASVARERMKALADELARFGAAFHIRDDSRLAFDYACDRGDAAAMTLPRVASEIACTQYLYDNTDYRALWESDMPVLAEYIRATYPRVSWRRTWQLIRETMDTAVKLQAFIQTAGHCPYVGA